MIDVNYARSLILRQVNEDPTTKIINDLRNEVLRLRGQLSLSQQSAGGGDAARISPDVKSSLLHAEEALRNYAKQWEAKQQSMRFVKSKLLKKRCAAFGAADLEESEIDSTPFLLSLSSDPLLDMAVKVFIPPGATLRIGRSPVTDDYGATDGAGGSGGGAGDGEGAAVHHLPDLQLAGLGIEEWHCVIAHSQEAPSMCESIVTLTAESGAVTYINGKQLSGGGWGRVRTERWRSCCAGAV